MTRPLDRATELIGSPYARARTGKPGARVSSPVSPPNRLRCGRCGSIGSVIGISVVEVAGRGVFNATRNSDGMVLAENSRQPVLDSARALIALGGDPNALLSMRHAGSETESLRAPIGKAAKLTVADNRYGTPKFRRYVPSLGAVAAPPIDETRKSEPPTTEVEKHIPTAEVEP
jgi:hypothetical protein